MDIQEDEQIRSDRQNLLWPESLSSARLHIRLFGGFELLQNGLPLPRMRSRTEKWLLALLVLRANQEIERAWLAGTFWPDTSPEQALNNLRRSLSNLRQVLGEEAYRLLSPTPHSLTFDLAGAFCDVTTFDAAIKRGDSPSLRKAMKLYSGPLLSDYEAEWVETERAGREQACIAALETLAAQNAAKRGRERIH